jgi:hypothetical protein
LYNKSAGCRTSGGISYRNPTLEIQKATILEMMKKKQKRIQGGKKLKIL